METKAIVRVTLPTFEKIQEELSNSLVSKAQRFTLSKLENGYFLLTENPEGGEHVMRWIATPLPEPRPNESFIAFDLEKETAWGVVKYQEEEIPIHELSIIGPGFLKNTHSSQSQEVLEIQTQYYSRTQSALGVSNWRRLNNLRVSLIGASGTGTWLAIALAKLGVGELKIWDPDYLEDHHFSRTPYSAEFLAENLNKAEALAKWLNINSPLLNIEGKNLDIKAFKDTPLKVLRYLTPLALSDLIIVATDSDVARAFAGVISNLFLIPLIDVAIGIDNEDEGVRVTWVLPYETCIFCLLPELKNREVLKAIYEGDTGKTENKWYDERKGSHIGLIYTAVGHAINLISALARGYNLSSGVLTNDWKRGKVSFYSQDSNTHRTGCFLKFLTGHGLNGIYQLSREIEDLLK